MNPDDYGENCVQALINDHMYSGEELSFLLGDDTLVAERLKILLGEIRQGFEWKPGHDYVIRLTVIERCPPNDS